MTKAAIRYHTNRQYIYRWRKRYDGTLSSLEDRSHRPRSHPNQHQPEEIKLIRDMRRRNPSAGLVVFWVKLRQRGYTRSISGLYRFLRRNGQMAAKLPNPKYIPKPYEQMSYPGQRVQIDVKFVPKSCLVGEAAQEGGYYQYTFLDEYSRFRYLEAFQEHSTYSSAQFIRNCVRKFSFAIECVQTDNGSEFTNRLNSSATKKLTLFEKTLAQLGIVRMLKQEVVPAPEAVTNLRTEAFVDGAFHAALHRSLERLPPFVQQLRLQAVLPLTDHRTEGRPLVNFGSPVGCQAVFPAMV